jgi:hypothetical protein
VEAYQYSGKQSLSNPVPPSLVSEGRKPVLVGKVRERFEQMIRQVVDEFGI